MKPVIFLAFANDKIDYSRYLRNLSKEHETIEDVFRTAEKQGFCEVKTVYNATFKKIADVFQDERYRDRIAVFHFGGHGDKDLLQLETSEGGHSFADSGGFSAFLASQKNLKLTFLNACNTQEFAQKLFEKGISAIGTSQKVYDDELLLDLIYRFYFGIAEKMDLQRAFSEAENLINSQYKTEIQEKYSGILAWKFWAVELYKNWKLENTQRPLNQFLVKNLTESLKFLPDVQKFFDLTKQDAEWENNPFYLKKAQDVLINAFGSVIGKELSRIFRIGKMQTMEGNDYLKHSLSCYKLALQVLSFSLVSQLSDLNHKSKLSIDKTALRAFFDASKPLSLAQWKDIFCGLLQTFKENNLSIPFKDAEFVIDHFLDTENLFQVYAKKIETLAQMPAAQVDLHEAEEILCHLLIALRFLTKYNVISVRDIEYHQFKNSNQRFIKNMQILKMGENSQNLVLKYDDKPIDSLSVFLQNSQTLINLSPFVLDFNTFGNEESTQIGLYEYTEQNLALVYFLTEKDQMQTINYEAKLEKIQKNVIKKEEAAAIKLETMLHNFEDIHNGLLDSNFAFQVFSEENSDDFGNL